MPENKNAAKLPLIYSCSGCSSAAQLANYLATRLDRRGLAEMSCIAGVGGDVPSLVRVAKSGRPIVAIDGCKLQCVKSCLERHGVTPTRQFVLSDYKVQKTFHVDFSEEDAQRLLTELEAYLATLKPAEGS